MEGCMLEALVGRAGVSAIRALRILRIARAKIVRKGTTALGRSLRPFSVRLADTEPEYCQALPTNQTIADIVKGAWCSRFPDEYAIEAGTIAHFDPAVEQRVTWVDVTLPGGVRGLSVLELGPFEAYNTWQLERLGAHPIVAIEANNLNYIKCLLVKEITGLQARFLYGDFMEYLEQHQASFDIVWASGVLYHQVEPLRLLALVAKVTGTIFLHTHYYDHEVIHSHPHLSALFVPARNVVAMHDGYRATLHYRSYRASRNALFSGGAEGFSYWMEREDILGFLRALGFAHIRVFIDDKNNPNGPGTCLLASRTGR
jgi:SAM-dependent methyltransferase